MILPLSLQAQNKQVLLNSANTLVLRGGIDAGSAIETQIKLAILVAKRGLKNYPIYLVLDSPGGSIEAGFMLIQFAKLIPNLHTISIFAASMASAIAQALPGERMVTENGTMMFHQAYAGVEGTVEVGSLETKLYYIKRRVLTLEKTNAARMKMNLAVYKEYVNKELWLDAEDSITYRSADNIVDIVCTQELIRSTNELTVAGFFGAATYKFSGCPLFRVPVSGNDGKVKYKLPNNGTK